MMRIQMAADQARADQRETEIKALVDGEMADPTWNDLVSIAGLADQV